ncbi:zinc-ribbon domain-containing protein [Streptomyces anulatus]|uniref:zinc-ribbon domain-containing protein n=1 Tax=Streptomyces anulatus TaxID=1892 RepID=UPI00355901FA
MRRPRPGYSLAERAPNLCSEWVGMADGSYLSPLQVPAGSSSHGRWRCGACQHEWTARISSRSTRGSGCPPCGARRAAELKSRARPDRSLTSEHPALAAQFNRTLNAPLIPEHVKPSSSKKLWWTCSCGTDFRARCSDRVRSGSLSCSRCSRSTQAWRQAAPGPGQSFADLHPGLALQWHPSLNEHPPSRYGPGSSRYAPWWRGLCGHDWQTSIARRVEGHGCPYCSGRMVGYGNDLATRRPDIASRWHPTANGSTSPDCVTPCSMFRAWWLCLVCEHVWSASVSSQTDGRGCPSCGRIASARGARIPRSGEHLTKTHPHLARQWHPSLNPGRPVEEVGRSSGHHAWWRGPCGHTWQMPVIARTRGANCPYCSGHRAGYGNDLASLHPDITSEWHPTRNGTLTPDQVVPGSAKAVWWKASCGHEWRTLVFVRTRGSGCPACWKARSSRQQTDLELALLTTVPGLSLRHRSIRAGGRWWQCDLVWPGRRLVVEFDGSYWHRNTAGRDRRKAEALRRAGWTVVRVRESPLRVLHPYDVVVPPVHLEGVLSTASRIVDHLRDCLLPSIPSSLDVVAAATLLADEGEAHYAWRNSTAASPRSPS